MTSGSANCHSALALKEHPGPQTVRAGRGVRRYSFRFPTARVPERQRSACPSRSPGRPAGRQEVASAADTPPSPIADKPTMPSISLIVSISSHRRSYGVQMRTGGSCWSGPDVRRTRVPRAPRSGAGRIEDEVRVHDRRCRKLFSKTSRHASPRARRGARSR